MGQHPNIRVELDSNPLYLSGVRDMVSSIARRVGFTDMNCSQIALAIDEALCNIMRHGYDKRTDGRIWLQLWPTPDPAGSPSITIVIEDEAKQVDPAQIKGRDLADIRPGGLGVHIIREVMDAVSYEKRESVGMRLTMRKQQKPSGSQGEGRPAQESRPQGSAGGCCPH